VTQEEEYLKKREKNREAVKRCRAKKSPTRSYSKKFEAYCQFFLTLIKHKA
jgi:hypothetical protein